LRRSEDATPSTDCFVPRNDGAVVGQRRSAAGDLALPSPAGFSHCSKQAPPLTAIILKTPRHPERTARNEAGSEGSFLPLPPPKGDICAVIAIVAKQPKQSISGLLPASCLAVRNDVALSPERDIKKAATLF